VRPGQAAARRAATARRRAQPAAPVAASKRVRARVTGSRPPTRARAATAPGASGTSPGASWRADVIVITPFLPSAAAAAAAQEKLIAAGASGASILGPEATPAELGRLVSDGLGQREVPEPLSGPALFGNDSAVLRPAAAGVLTPLLPLLRQPGATAVINGYASAPGDAPATSSCPAPPRRAVLRGLRGRPRCRGRERRHPSSLPAPRRTTAGGRRGRRVTRRGFAWPAPGREWVQAPDTRQLAAARPVVPRRRPVGGTAVPGSAASRAHCSSVRSWIQGAGLLGTQPHRPSAGPAPQPGAMHRRRVVHHLTHSVPAPAGAGSQAARARRPSGRAGSRQDRRAESTRRTRTRPARTGLHQERAGFHGDQDSIVMPAGCQVRVGRSQRKTAADQGRVSQPLGLPPPGRRAERWPAGGEGGAPWRAPSVGPSGPGPAAAPPPQGDHGTGVVRRADSSRASQDRAAIAVGAAAGPTDRAVRRSPRPRSPGRRAPGRGGPTRLAWDHGPNEGCLDHL
jgi:outer membrane protein OmpA-like peptidoglycan-associated protein